jgi:hypothetical protein
MCDQDQYGKEGIVVKAINFASTYKLKILNALKLR